MYWRQFASHGAADRARVADLVGKIKVVRATMTQKQQSARGLPIHRNNRYNALLKL